VARVTVLLTCYNHREFLPLALGDALRQTYPDLEVIALDDGSTDGSREWLRDQSNPRLRLQFHEQNLGTYGSLNVGLKLADGEYVAILNDDDRWHPEKIEQQVAYLDGHPDDALVHTGGTLIDSHGSVLKHNPLGFDYPVFPSGPRWLNLVYRNEVITSAALVRRRCFEAVGPFDTTLFGSADWDMWLRLAERWRLGCIDLPLTQYRVHEGSASQLSQRILRDDLSIRERLRSQLAMNESLDRKQRRAAQAHNEAALGVVYRKLGERQLSRRAFVNSIRFAPTRLKSWARLIQAILG
jgi:glycosyltransferase involved in cell wall biosynthesis